MKKQRYVGNHLIRFLCFLVPLAVMTFCFICQGYVPFGDSTPLLGDAGCEYYPMLLLLRRSVQAGQSLLYTWRSVFGTDFLPTIAYFCVSPFHLTALFLPESAVHVYLSVSILIHAGLMGLFFSVLLETVRKKLDVYAVWFSTMYAVSAWMLGSFFQTVWLDCIALTPLVLAGVIKMVRDRDFRLYPLALGLTIACNYYLSFIVCCMTGLFWIGVLIVRKIPMKSLPKETGKFLGFSVLGASFSAVLLLTTAALLPQTSTAGERITDWTEVYGTLGGTIGQLVSFSKMTYNQHPANMACSILVVLLFAGYLTARRISLRERIYGGFVLIFMLVSLWYAPLSFVWHGFHFPHVTVDRFAYMVPMVLAFMGWRYMVTLEDIQSSDTEPTRSTVLPKVMQLAAMAICTAAVLFCADRYEATDVVLLPALFALLYLIVLGIRIFVPKRASICRLGLSAVFLAELLYSSRLDISYIPDNVPASSLLPDAAVSEAVAQTKADAAENGEYFFRTGVDGIAGYNVELLYDIDGGVEGFSSLIPHDLNRLSSMLGYVAHDSGYTIMSQQISPLAMLLTDTQYMISDQSGHALLDALTEQQDEGSFVPYRFSYDAKLGYCIPDAVSLPEADSDFAAQNAIFSEMTGLNGDLLVNIPQTGTEVSDLTADPTDAGMLHIVADEIPEALLNGADAETEMIDSDDKTKFNPKITFEFEIPEDGYYYLNRVVRDGKSLGALFRSEMFRKCRIWVDGEYYAGSDLSGTMSFGLKNNLSNSLAIGYLHAGQTLSAEYGVYAMTDIQMQLFAARLDEDLLEEGYARLTQSPFALTDFSDTALTCTADAQEDCVLYLSIPYDTGWKAEVDGMKAETFPVLDAMTGIRLTAGSHTVSMHYVPKGFRAGAVISILGICGYIMLLIAETVRIKKRRGTDNANS